MAKSKQGRIRLGCENGFEQGGVAVRDTLYGYHDLGAIDLQYIEEALHLRFGRSAVIYLSFPWLWRYNGV